jgi:hypothetical protein
MNYIGIGKNEGICVDRTIAFKYALERIIGGTDEEKAEFVEWFYSGDWYYEETKEEF